jgi:hypothetical protein
MVIIKHQRPAAAATATLAPGKYRSLLLLLLLLQLLHILGHKIQ